MLAAIACGLVLLIWPGVHTAGAADFSAVTAGICTVKTKNTEAQDASNSSYPFGELPEMKLLLQALDIIGETSIDELSAEQLQELEELGFDQQTLEENANLLKELTQDAQTLANGEPALETDGMLFEENWSCFAGTAAIIAAVGLGVYVYRRSRHT